MAKNKSWILDVKKKKKSLWMCMTYIEKVIKICGCTWKINKKRRNK